MIISSIIIIISEIKNGKILKDGMNEKAEEYMFQMNEKYGIKIAIKQILTIFQK